jgi:hypothetical protein
MSRGRSNKRPPAWQGPGRTSPPRTGARSIRTTSLLLLVCVVFVVALLMVVSFVEFVLKPDPTVKAVPMYVTLTLTTGAALLMFVMALNASFLPFISRERAPNVHLVMWAMGVTGIVTGLLTLGRAASPFVTRLVLGGIAFTFITMQNARLARARAAQSGQRAAQPAEHAAPPAPRPERRSRARQRRGGRKR